MTPLDQLLETITVFDYADFFGNDLYHLESVPEVWEQVNGTQKRLVSQDWDNAVWVPYLETELGKAYNEKCNRSITLESRNPEQDFSLLLSQSLTFILSLSPDSIRQQLNRLSLLGTRIIEVTDEFWPYIKDGGLWKLDDLNRGLSQVFRTKNYPDYGRIDSLYFAKAFWEWVDVTVFNKGKILFQLIQDIQNASGVGIDIDQIKKVLKPLEPRPQILNVPDAEEWLNQSSTFNGMKGSELLDFFSRLHTKTNKLNEPFLTEAETKHFVKCAFFGSTPANLSFNLGKAEKWAVVSLFFGFKEYCLKEKYERSNRGIGTKYIEVLSSHFSNYDFPEVKDNFSKFYDHKMKRFWGL
jgi:hypothetical protein